jgi:hypothetical protein
LRKVSEIIINIDKSNSDLEDWCCNF